MHASLAATARRQLTAFLLGLAACGGTPSEQPAAPTSSVPSAAEAPAGPPAPSPPPGAAEQPTAEPAPAPAAAPTADTPTAPAAPAEPVGTKSTKTAAKPSAPVATPSATPAPTAPAAPAAPAQATPVACGEKGQPRCPLQAFMEDEIDKPLEDGALEQVAAALAQVAKMAPDPAWNAGGPKGFRGLAEAAAAAARANDVPTLQQTCKSCHKAFRREYKAKYRPRPLP